VVTRPETEPEAPKERVVGAPSPKAKQDSAVKKSSSQKPVDAARVRGKQTLYLSQPVRKALKLRAIEDECEMSEVAEKALRRFLKM